jgi:thiosulfate/3-mercaptopyruvate sulfurtransferase
MAELIDARTLHAELQSNHPPVLLDVRWSLAGPPGRGLYASGHLPGARFVDLDQDLSSPHVPGETGRHPLPSAETFEAAMRRAGVSQGSRIVLYDVGDGFGSARAWWCLKYFRGPGSPPEKHSGGADAAILDGGYRSWIEAGLPVEDGTPQPEPGTFSAKPGGMPLLDAAAAADLATQGVLLDARPANRFRGEDETIDPLAGHIPGAVSAPATQNTHPNGRFLAPEQLRERFAALGVDGSRPVGAYCGSGVTAAHEVFALELAGVQAALYAGSWSDWITDPDRPIATGG